MENETLNILKQHMSIRAFTDQVITDEQIATILSAAVAGPNMGNFQPVTFIEITQQSLKQAITDAVKMHYIATAKRFFVVVIDYNRILIGLNAEERQKAEDKLSYYSMLEGAIISAGIALGRAQVAAESMGIGTVTMAGTNRALELYQAHLNLPRYVKPVMGFSLGYPDQNPGIKPKLPLSGFWMKDTYQQVQLEKTVALYDETMKDYYKKRELERTWTSNNKASLLADQNLADFTTYAKQQGFNLK